MADNYIGKKMEDYERTRGVKPVRRVSVSNVKSPIAGLRVVVADGLTSCGIRTVERMRALDCKVAFCGDDERVGRALAQRTGARFYPSISVEEAIADLREQWGGIDLVITSDTDADPDKPLSINVKEL